MPTEPEDDLEELGEDSESVDYTVYNVTLRQKVMYDATEQIVERFGRFNHGSGPDGAHYMDAYDNPFIAEGMICANCVAFRGGRACEWVEGDVSPNGLCKLWVIPADLMATPVEITKKAADSYEPPKGVREEAARALKWIGEGHAGQGFTAVGAARARDLSNGRGISVDTLKRMRSYFARHEVDKQGEGWSPESAGYPSPGRVAWAAWGGDAGRAWANDVLKGVERMEKAVTLDTMAEERFTLAPWYIPNKYDAHEEWTDPEELQKALWDYVRSGDRAIRLQHNRDVVAGEWVEAMTMPFPVTMPMKKSDGRVDHVEYPAGTVFLGVKWDEWAWDMVKAGEITGYSIGGSAERIEVGLDHALLPQED
jgi:hypothetical protein